MRILILGGGGMLGQKIAKELAQVGGINGRAITELHLVDAIAKPNSPESAPFKVSSEIQDITATGVCNRLVETRPDLIFHLAAVVSGEAELNL